MPSRDPAREAADAAGLSRLVWWLLGIVTTIALGAVTAWTRSTSQKVDTIVPAVAADHQAITDTHERLVRIEDKLDKALENK